MSTVPISAVDNQFWFFFFVVGLSNLFFSMLSLYIFLYVPPIVGTIFVCVTYLEYNNTLWVLLTIPIKMWENWSTRPLGCWPSFSLYIVISKSKDIPKNLVELAMPHYMKQLITWPIKRSASNKKLLRTCSDYASLVLVFPALEKYDGCSVSQQR